MSFSSSITSGITAGYLAATLREHPEHNPGVLDLAGPVSSSTTYEKVRKTGTEPWRYRSSNISVSGLMGETENPRWR